LICSWYIKESATYMRKLRNCEKPECQLRNSYTVISWLKEPIELGNRPHKKKASAEAEVKTD